MKLVIPIIDNDKIYTDCEIKRPETSIIINTQEKSEEGKLFFAMFTFVSGCITQFKDIDDNVIDNKETIKLIAKKLPQQSIEVLAIQIMLLLDSQDGIEGIYSCPRCNEKIYAEEKDGIDTRDFISELGINYYNDMDNTFIINYEYPITLTVKNTEDKISVIKYRFPAIDDYIQAEAMYTLKNQFKLQIEVYRKCIVEVNGEKVDKNWINNFGSIVMQKADIKDTNKISKEIKKYGYQTEKEKNCPKCGKQWKAEINTNNFFVSGLLS